jgi:hypothetical protein
MFVVSIITIRGSRMKTFYQIVMSKSLEPDVAFLQAQLYEEAFDNTEKIRTKKGFEMVNVPIEKNPEREAEIWVEEDKDSPFYKKNPLAGCIELKGKWLTGARRKRPDLKGQKNVKAYLFFGKA